MLITATITYLQTTDAEFRQQISDVIANLTAVGLTPVTQTGEVNTATATKPTAGNQKAWWKMFRWNDGQTELYLKAFFGSGNEGATTPEISFQIGFAVDGSGNFTDAQKSSIHGIRFTGAAIATRFVKNGGAVVFNLNDQKFLSVDRSRNGATGAITGEGATLVSGTTDLSVSNDVLSFQPRGVQEYVASANGVWGPLPCVSWFNMSRPPFGTTWGRGANVGVCPHVPWDAGGKPSPITLCFGSATDFAAVGTVVPVPMYGTTRNYRTMNIVGDTNAFTRVLVLDG